jgi:UV DNA damage repair endonuclease
MIKKIGFACKFVAVNKKGLIESVEGLNTGGTTITYLKKAGKNVAERKMWEVMETNIKHTHNLVMRVAKLAPELRIVRLTSDMMTAYTHEDWAYFYKLPDVVNRMEQLFAPIGETARKHNVRLSFHPGQFCCIVSDNENVVNNSITELEYHADMVRMMGYGNKKLEFKINVHLSGRGGASKFHEAFDRLSPELRNCLTLENDEYQAGLDDVLVLADYVGIVLDIHHHFIKTGEYISAEDDRIKRVIDSWQGVRPTIHYSLSREDILVNHDTNVLPDLTILLESGHKKQKLRAHSDMMWNTAANQWAKTHWEWADVMVEAKNKNLASFALYQEWMESTGI